MCLLRVKPRLHNLPMEIGVRIRKRKIHPEIRPTAPLPPNRAGSLAILQMWVSVLAIVGAASFQLYCEAERSKVCTL
jgi:hypothetical protein